MPQLQPGRLAALRLTAIGAGPGPLMSIMAIDTLRHRDGTARPLVLQAGDERGGRLVLPGSPAAASSRFKREHGCPLVFVVIDEGGEIDLSSDR